MVRLLSRSDSVHGSNISALEDSFFQTMLALTDSQLRVVWNAVDRVPVEKRGVFLERVVARLRLHRGFTDVDLDDALTGLVQSAA